MTGTALGANKKKNTRTITFKNEAHRMFYETYLPQCRYQDGYHKALVYCLGIDPDTREHVDKIYNFKTGCVNSDCLYDEWQTSGSMKVVRMAFNLYCSGMPSLLDVEDEDYKLKECRMYTVDELFCCGYARYFWEAIKLRYQEYCFYIDLEDLFIC